MFSGHLHLHTEYSALDGLCKIEEAINKAKSLGQRFIAITDHGSSSGLYDASELSKKLNFPVLLGEEFYYANPDGLKPNGHILLLAKNEVGIKNIYQMQAEAYSNFYYKPRINLDILKEHSEGIVCTTACIANQVGQYILADETPLAMNHIIELSNIFGDDFYLEIQSSTNEDVIKVNKKLLSLAKTSGHKVIITNDVHYVNKEDYDVHEVFLCIQQKSKMNSPKRWRFEQNDYWIKSEKEIEEYMPYLTREEFDKCYENIDEIFEKCKDVHIEGGNYLPKWIDPDGLSEEDALDKLTLDSYFTRQKDRNETNTEYLKDLMKELDVIKSTGYAGYFMIVQEYANWARKNNILVGDGRGSGAGCKVAYTIGITEVNPQKYDLLFERFLSPGREPDFDIDFSDIGAVFTHLQDRYGKNNVARVGAFNRFTCKSALRKVMGVYSFPQSQISQIVGLLPNRLSFTLEEALNENPQFKKWMEEHKNVFKCVAKLEGILSHMSTHAGGVIICDGLTSKLPVFTDSEDREKLIVAYDKHIISDLGHYKFDVLGLKSLTLLKDTLENIGEEINWSNVNFEDESVYDMLCNGDVLGVFQLSEQEHSVKLQQPRCFEDLIAINAIIRPGTCDFDEYLTRRANHQESPLQYMNCTHGLIVYQDQYLQLAQTYAGWGIAFSDKNIRKNKNILTDEPLHQKFINDGIENGYDKDELEKVWSDIISVAGGGYGFNRAHSTSYARLSYQTAWLKKYYPKEFYGAYLTQNFDDTDEIIKVQALLKKQGIELLPPDVNTSTNKFSIRENGIMFPITSIKGVGGSILTEINRLKPIKNFDDFKERRIPKFCKKTAMYALIKAGAFDFSGEERNAMLEKAGYDGEFSENKNYDKETLGIYLSDNPLEKIINLSLTDKKDKDKVIGGGQISDIHCIYDKNGNEMCFVTIATIYDSLQGVIFSSIWKKFKDTFEVDDICYIEGTYSRGSILINKIETI